uniref:CCHC-type domain-containing protein n=1 Tax=Salmo trutta TaxID=8032 RepID=A0A674AP51_SALTR
MASTTGMDKRYERHLTLAVEIVCEEKITMMELLRGIKEVCGSVVGCRFKANQKYEITMNHAKGNERLMDGFKIKNSRIMAKDLVNDELVVSFMNLPAYISDDEIHAKLNNWGVAAVSKIKRRVWPGTDIVDGTRFCKVKFTDTVQSLPYSAKFETLKGTEYFRIIHDKQVKVCRLCIQPGHVLRECQEFTCRRCGEQGHYARECNLRDRKCRECGKETCICTLNLVDDREPDKFSEEEGVSERVEEEKEDSEVELSPDVVEPTLRSWADDVACETPFGPSLDDVDIDLAQLPKESVTIVGEEEAQTASQLSKPVLNSCKIN